MLKTAALAALVMLDDFKPKAESRAEKYITDRVPMPPLLSVVPDSCPHGVWLGERCFKCEAVEEKPAKRRREPKPRRKHVCTWTDRDVWGACTFTFILGAFLAYVVF